MGSKGLKLILFLGLAVGLGSLGYSLSSAGLRGGSRARSPAMDIGVLATPPGITLEPLGVAQGYQWDKQTATFLPRDQITFATPKGLTLYTYELDPPGKSTCVDACAQAWPPAAAPDNAKVFGDWSVLIRGDGSRQWTYKRKPLYTYAKDVDPGSVYGHSPARFGMKRRNAAGKTVGGEHQAKTADAPLPDGWKVALAYPISGMVLPAELSVKEVPDAAGLVLVDRNERTLYVFSGDPGDEARLHEPWLPAEAPQISNPVGDFAFIVRQDGIKQWTYKGQPLYHYTGDLVPGDANGADVDKHWAVAAVVRYYRPAGVHFQMTLARGKVLATAQGKTLYRREAHIDQTGGGHGLRRGQPMRPAVGREIGIDHVRCDTECLKVWHPYEAPDEAMPQGQWTVVTHPDGFRQWVYQGYPLWTYDGDKAPGDMNGNDDEIYFFADTPSLRDTALREASVEIGTPQSGGAGLYWEIAIP